MITPPSSSTRLDARVRTQFELSWGKARSYIETGKILVDGKVITDLGSPTASSALVELKINAPSPKTLSKRMASGGGPGSLLAPRVVFSDTQLVVVSKPAGLSTVPYEGEPQMATLEQWVCNHLKQSKVFVVHRLDRETSGLIVFARTAPSSKALSNQFRFHTVARRYLALAQGQVIDQTIRSDLIENRGDGLRGSVRPGGLRVDAKPAVTHVKVLAHWPGVSLIECRLETGRTHQIRIHLSEAGHPLLGEKAYIREFSGAKVEAPRLMLHAAELGFEHPTRNIPMRWTEAPPADFIEMVPLSARQWSIL